MRNGAHLANYGTEELGRLRTVMLHRPVDSIHLVNSGNYVFHLFDSPPDPDRYLAEHARYAALLRSLGVEVIELSEHVHANRALLQTLPNLAYMHDVCVVTGRGAILSRMMPGTRSGEDTVVKEALHALGVPVWWEFGPGDQFEGCLLLSPRTIFIAGTERHSRQSIAKFIPKALDGFGEVIYAEIPQERRYMHPDMVLNRISRELMLAYLPAFKRTYRVTKSGLDEIEFSTLMKSRGIEVISISDDEQRRWGCSFVPIEPDMIVHYDISLARETRRLLTNRGVEIIDFHPDALLAGGGSLRCLTLRLWREPDGVAQPR